MEVTTREIRELMERPASGSPVTTVYLNTDGARYPRPADYEARLDGLLREVQQQAEALDSGARESVGADAAAVRKWVRDVFDRGDTRGLGLFATGGEVFETVQVALGVRNVARLGPRPYVVPLEALVGRQHHIALALISRDRARVLRYRLGVLEEHRAIEAEVHGQHEQGGWAQARYQRGIEHDVLHHYKDVAEVLLALHEEEPVDALVVAGGEAETAEFDRSLHPYLQAVRRPTPHALPFQAAPDEIRELLAEVEQDLVSTRRRKLLERLAAGTGQAGATARGIRHVLEAVNAKRIDTLFVVEGAGEPGYRSASGALALHADEAAAYGEPVEAVTDVVDEIIEEAVRSGSHIELFRDDERLDGHPVAALLRF
ncbi:hypothetical protein ER308_00315 [Egibacter rhizosphaerae]|uniref:Peptide chain release factor 1 n=1 Tax=Egibacter rhizosphaerae TaxID=1670831 RepID=A0A411YAG3_9ACTN|nr:Vms1/Ankzf1 family peptidyl-tRNA hydrolase [Egibacter rhizosphaerae]QBI18167.1 hypothetical protein ER308_00315 [Egibacter rhizosphaerae]